jgi:hypothetical protein
VTAIEQRSIVFKTVSEVSLELYLYDQVGRDRSIPVPAIVFFFGGGWRAGTPSQFFPHCEYLAGGAGRADFTAAARAARTAAGDHIPREGGYDGALCGGGGILRGDGRVREPVRVGRVWGQGARVL